MPDPEPGKVELFLARLIYRVGEEQVAKIEQSLEHFQNPPSPAAALAARRLLSDLLEGET